MKPVNVSKDILPLGKFKSQASQVLRELKNSHRPVVITQNGSPAAVMIRPEDFEMLLERDRFVSSVGAGLKDASLGRVISEEEAERRLSEEFGEIEE